MKTIIITILLLFVCVMAGMTETYIVARSRTTGKIDPACKLPESMASNVVLWYTFSPAIMDSTTSNYWDYANQPSTNRDAIALPAAKPGWDSANGGSIGFAGKASGTGAQGIRIIKARYLIHGTSNVTFSCWAKWSLGSTKPLFGYAYFMFTGLDTPVAGTVRFSIRTAANVVTLEPLGTFNDGVWHHLVGTYDGVSMSIYVDSIQTTNFLRAGAIQTWSGGSVDDLGIGAHYEDSEATVYCWTGNVANVILFNRGLTGTEVTNLYTVTRGKLGV